MVDEEKSPETQKVGVTGWLSIAFILVFVGGGLLAFVKLLFEGGWSSAVQKYPAGAVIFFVALAGGYFFALLSVEKKNKDAARKMIWVGVAIVGLFLVSFLPSCDDNGQPPTDIYFRR